MGRIEVVCRNTENKDIGGAKKNDGKFDFRNFMVDLSLDLCPLGVALQLWNDPSDLRRLDRDTITRTML